MVPIPASALAIASKIGWRGAAIGALAIGLGVQTVRVELKDSALEACEARKAVLRAEIDQMRAAQAEAEQLALEDRLRREQQSIENARFSDAELLNARQEGIDWANAHNARRSLRPETRLRGGGTIAAPGDSDTAGGNGTDTAAFVDATEGLDDPVAVEAADVLICTDAVLRLEAVQEWAAGLNTSP